EQEAVALRNFVPGEAAGVKGKRIAGVVQAVAVLEPGREFFAIGLVGMEIGDHLLVERKVGGAFFLRDAVDRLVVAIYLLVGLVREVFADGRERQKRQLRLGLL